MLRKLALGAALLASVAPVGATAAEAAPTELTVRIEGATKTLFEGPILTDGHPVRASSDSADRPCDGTNGGANPAPGPTPTAAGADAMELIGQSFDARWFAGFDDYFLRRWGPDSEDAAAGAFWGLFVDYALPPIGGCQREDAAGDEVLWAYDAFSGRPPLRLAPAGEPPAVTAPPTARVEAGQPLTLEVQAFGGGEGEGPVAQPAEGVVVAPVATEPGTGYETVEVGDPAAVATAADGTATVTFDSPGWRRLKAQDEAGHIRSNRLDVCVEPAAGGGCGPPPADARLRVPGRYLLGAGGGEPPAMPGQPPRGSAGVLLLRGVRRDLRAGTATIEALAPGPGHLTLSGRGIRGRSLDLGEAGPLALRIVPTTTARRALRRLGRLGVSVRVEFQAAAGEPSSLGRALTLRWRPPRR